MRALIFQLARFGLVGIAATGVHFVVALALHWVGLALLLANVAAFLAAFQVSYWGHSQWSFGGARPVARAIAAALFWRFHRGISGQRRTPFSPHAHDRIARCRDVGHRAGGRRLADLRSLEILGIRGRPVWRGNERVSAFPP